MTSFLNSLLTQGFATFIGATLAFAFALKLYRHKIKEQNKDYLHYVLSSVAAEINELYSFKRQMGEKRYKEVIELQDRIKKGNTELHMVEIGKYMYGAHFSLSICLEKCHFLVNREPNLIVLIHSLLRAFSTLNDLSTDINNEIKTYMSGEKPTSSPNLLMTIEKNKLFYELMDDCLYLLEKAMKELIKFGVLEYKKDLQIKSFELTKGEYKDLQPKPVKSWENSTYKWFPEKESLWNKWIKKYITL